MSEWPSTKARSVLAALPKIGWQVKRQTGSHRTLSREGWPDVVFAFHDREEIAPTCWRELQCAPACVLTISKVTKPADNRLKPTGPRVTPLAEGRKRRATRPAA